jgi:hypothetical protein
MRTRTLISLLFLVATFGLTPPASAEMASETQSEPDVELRLGDPIEHIPEERATAVARPEGLVQSQALTTSVDPFDRLSVVDFYQCEYVPSEDYISGMGWVGDVNTCDAGTVNQSFHDDTLRRINFYRAMTGLNSNITFDATKNSKSQEAALIMSRNCGLSHSPISEFPGWACLTADGDEAAGFSNLSLGFGGDHTGPDAVDGQMREAGSSNHAVGHRRWLLYPRAVEMGNGGIPNGAQCSAGVVWVIGDFGSRPASPEWVSWPNAGFVPYNLAFDRWSFSLFGANFDSATVSMMHDGAPVPLTIIHPTVSSPAAGIGDPSIVWEPIGIPSTVPASDETYEVTISGITGAAQTSYVYDVTLVDPADAGLPLGLSGSLSPVVGLTNTYTFPTSAASGGYTLRAREVDDIAWKEGAEPTDPNLWIDGTDPSYSLVTSGVPPQAGTQSFHFAFPDFTDQSMELDRSILPSVSSDLTFYYLRRFSSIVNTISAEVSTDDGANWSSVWSTVGICSGSCSSSGWDATWQSATVSLSAYADSPLRVRFVYSHNGSIFTGTSSSYGVFIDEVSVSNSGSLGSEALTPVAAGQTQVDFVPSAEEQYLLDLQANLVCFDSAYGPKLSVIAVPEPHFVVSFTAGLLMLAALNRRRQSRSYN